MTKTVEIPLEKLKDPDSPLRETPDDESILDLASSISEIGLINPLLVKQVGDHYEVVAGHRRFLALKILKPKTVRCSVIEKSYKKEEEAQLAENVTRKDLTPIEEAIAISNIMEKKHLSPKMIAKQLGKSFGFVKGRLALLDIQEDLQEAIQHKNMPVGTAMMLSRVDDDETRRRWIHEAIRSQASGRTIGLWVNGYLQSKAALDSRELEEGELISDKKLSEPKGRCWICKGNYRYPDMKSVLLCHDCYIKLLKAMLEGRADAVRHVDQPSDNIPGDNLH